MKKDYKKMFVSELRDEMRSRGLKLESKGHKFTKAELIEKIEKDDAEKEDDKNDINKKIIESGSDESEKCNVVFAVTLDEIEKKYKTRKDQNVYDKKLRAGSLVVFVHYVEAKDGNVYKRLRTAKVVAVNRAKELVKVQTLLGYDLMLSYDDLLFIRSKDSQWGYPKDINEYLKKQRTQKGRELINERYDKNLVNN